MKVNFSQKAFSIAKTKFGNLIVGLAFGKFSKLLPIKRVKETDKVIAFWHPAPSWEKHIVIVPKKRIVNLTTLKDEDLSYIGECLPSFATPFGCCDSRKPKALALG